MVVELLDSFEAIKKHAERCHEILYMIEPAGLAEVKGEPEQMRQMFRIRIRVGTKGWDKTVPALTAKEILEKQSIKTFTPNV